MTSLNQLTALVSTSTIQSADLSEDFQSDSYPFEGPNADTTSFVKAVCAHVPSGVYLAKMAELRHPNVIALCKIEISAFASIELYYQVVPYCLKTVTTLIPDIGRNLSVQSLRVQIKELQRHLRSKQIALSITPEQVGVTSDARIKVYVPIGSQATNFPPSAYDGMTKLFDHVVEWWQHHLAALHSEQLMRSTFESSRQAPNSELFRMSTDGRFNSILEQGRQTINPNFPFQYEASSNIKASLRRSDDNCYKPSSISTSSPSVGSSDLINHLTDLPIEVTSELNPSKNVRGQHDFFSRRQTQEYPKIFQLVEDRDPILKLKRKQQTSKGSNPFQVPLTDRHNKPSYIERRLSNDNKSFNAHSAQHLICGTGFKQPNPKTPVSSMKETSRDYFPDIKIPTSPYRPCTSPKNLDKPFHNPNKTKEFPILSSRLKPVPKSDNHEVSPIKTTNDEGSSNSQNQAQLYLRVFESLAKAKNAISLLAKTKSGHQAKN